MEFIGYPEQIFAAICPLLLHRLNRKTPVTNWPVVGMFPSLLVNLHRIHEEVTDILSQTECNFVLRGPWFSNMTDMLLTSDPANMRYIYSTNFSNYPKGSEFQEFFDILGDGIVNVDSDSWKLQRSIAHRLISQEKFRSFLQQTARNKLENALIPVLEHVLEKNTAIDLQDLFKRFMFDTTVILLSGADPVCLSTEFRNCPQLEALVDAEEAIFNRHILPMKVWKLQRPVGIGTEKKMAKAKECLDQFILKCILSKQQAKALKVKTVHEEAVQGMDLLTSYMEENEVSDINSDSFLRDSILNLMVAGSTTVAVALTWFFYLISKNPMVEAKIITELKAVSPRKDEKLKIFDITESNELVYLHGALCEALRLVPSVPFEHKRPLHPDILPSGHRVDSGTKIIPVIYSMGRMKSVWGDDCLEFKPERWISEKGEIKHVSSYKFMAFNSEPRTCLGKGIAFTQTKLVVATLLYNYRVELEENQSITPKNAIVLYMKNGMNVKIRRC